MSQLISTQGAVYDCLLRDEHRLVLIGIARHIGDAVALTSPLPGRLKERLSGRRWNLYFVDRRRGFSHYRSADSNRPA